MTVRNHLKSARKEEPEKVVKNISVERIFA